MWVSIKECRTPNSQWNSGKRRWSWSGAIRLNLSKRSQNRYRVITTRMIGKRMLCSRGCEVRHRCPIHQVYLKKVKGEILFNPTIAIREWIMSEKCKTLWFKLLLTTPLLSIIFNVTFAYNQAENIFRPQGACCEWGAWAYVSLENSTCFPLKSWTQLWEYFD